MAIYYGKSNGWKGKITKAQWPAFSGLSGTAQQKAEQAGVIIRDVSFWPCRDPSPFSWSNVGNDWLTLMNHS